MSPSPETKAIVKEWCEMQRAKYGPDWKRVVAKQMSDAATPYVEAILKLGNHGRSA